MNIVNPETVKPTLKKLRTLLVKFDNALNIWEVPAFRGAVIEKVGREHLLFHHHLTDKKHYFQYPMVQYKSLNRYAGILCLGDGVDEIHKLFNHSTWDINLKEEIITLTIEKLNLDNFVLNIGHETYKYNLWRWLALNEKNYKKYKSIDNEIEKINLLEKILIGNILSFAKGIGWDIKNEIKIRINNIKKTRDIKYKDVHLMALDVDFMSNAQLPDYIGLGKGVSHGYGVIKKLNK